MVIRAKSVYEASAPEDGLRVLVMRKWPRGIAKAAVHEWRRDLGPSEDLLADWQSRSASWAEFSRRYREEVAGRVEVDWLKGKAQEGTVTILCGCKEEAHCHRLLLRQIIEKLARQ
ncbi:MAG: DUF488 family protein [Chloroflexi bacterium]|nr:DUF488 family protein [Chloroflexota bacterium]